LHGYSVKNLAEQFQPERDLKIASGLFPLERHALSRAWCSASRMP